MLRAPGGKLLLTTPERISDPAFRELLRESANNVGVSRLVVDEAHCVSQWGHDFRPSYLTIRRALEDVSKDGKRPPVLATTATAPPHVREDILHQLGMPNAKLVTTTFDRPNLHYEVIALAGDDEKQKTLVTLLKRLPKPGIVYCATVKKVNELHESLSRHGIEVARYTGRMTKNEREASQQAFMASRTLVMIATNAFGLGVDKPNIRYVLHYHVPGSLESYAQEAGRGGRDNRPARCVLLFSPDDVAIQEYFLKGTYPTRRQVRAVHRTLEAWEDHSHEDAPPTIANLALSAHVGAQRTRTVLNLLKDEKFVVEGENDTWSLASPPPDPKLLLEKARQYEARRIADRQRLDSLLDYVGTPDCRSEIILSYLGEDDPPSCGRCDNCLRSKEAALAASARAYRLEESVTRELDMELGEEVSKPRRLIRHRVIRIDKPAEGAIAPASNATGALQANATPESDAPVRPIVRAVAASTMAKTAPAGNGGSPPSAQLELESLIAAQGSDEDEFEDDDLEDDDLEDDEFEDDEYEDDEFGDDEFEDDIEIIDKTAAALAEEGVDRSDSEITILARKRVPKPPRGSKPSDEPVDEASDAEKKRRRRRRRRRRRSIIPPKSAFTSPVLSTGATTSATPGRRSAASTSGPVIEYVRGPMRINMTPVASATPNDVAPAAHKKRRRRKPQGDSQQGPTEVRAIAPRPTADGDPSPKKRRRRRRRKKKGADNGGAATTDTQGPVTFFSVDWSKDSTARDPSGQAGSGPRTAQAGQAGASNDNAEGEGQKKRRRRRRRRGRGGKPGGATVPDASSDTPAAPSTEP